MIRILKEAEVSRDAIFAREDPVESVEAPVRAIIEDVMLDTMFDLPSRKDVTACTITPASVRGEEAPVLTLGQRRKKTRSRRAESTDESFGGLPEPSVG